ncbi:MAG TPA: hypothetical protein VF721_17230 [Pyrinomonadaceae bacterium]
MKKQYLVRNILMFIVLAGGIFAFGAVNKASAQDSGGLLGSGGRTGGLVGSGGGAAAGSDGLMGSGGRADVSLATDFEMQTFALVFKIISDSVF